MSAQWGTRDGWQTSIREVAQRVRAMTVKKVMVKAIDGQISRIQAAEIIGITARHMRRLKQRYEHEGYHGLVLCPGLCPRPPQLHLIFTCSAPGDTAEKPGNTGRKPLWGKVSRPTVDSGSCGVKPARVQVPPFALHFVTGIQLLRLGAPFSSSTCRQAPITLSESATSSSRHAFRYSVQAQVERPRRRRPSVRKANDDDRTVRARANGTPFV